MRYLGGNNICAVFTALLAIFYLVENRKYPLMGDYGISSGFLPLILGVTLLCLSLIWLVSNWFSDKDFHWRELIPSRGPIFVILMLIVCTLLFNVAGTIISLSLLTGSIWLFYEKLSWRYSLITSVSIAVFMYVVFHYGLGIPMPGGWESIF